MQCLALSAFLGASCCHINRLPDRGHRIKTVAYEVSAVDRPTVRFTSHRAMDIRREMRPVAVWSHNETKFERLLAPLGGEKFSAIMLEQAHARLGASLGWALDESGAGADALIQILVENICFCAPDVLTGVEVKVDFKAVLTSNTDGEVLWRDCLDWTLRGDFPSLEQLGQVEALHHEDLLSDLAAQLLGRLASHLADQAKGG
jgi:hypothetical protein